MRGHRVLTPDLTPDLDQPLEQWSASIAELLTTTSRPLLLVGHSRGGAVISQVAERVPEAIDMLVYLAAFLLDSGETVAARGGMGDGPPPGLELSADQRLCTVAPQVAAALFFQDALPEATGNAVAALRPEPLASFYMPIATSAERFGTVRRVYIETLQDIAIPIATQRAMQADLPCERVFTIDSGHSPFVTNIQELTEILVDLADQLVAAEAAQPTP